MTFPQLLRVLLARWFLIISLAVAGFAVAYAWARTSSRIYEATAQVILSARTPDALGQQSGVDQVLPDYLSTQMDVIRSDRIAQQVVQRLQLASSPRIAETLGWHGQGGSLEQFLAKQMQGALNISAGRSGSRVIEISYRATSPAFAAVVANAFAKAYQEVSLDLRAEPARTSAQWYKTRSAQQQAELREAQAKVAAKQRELGVLSTNPGQLGADEARLQALSGQLAAAQAQQAQSGARTGGGALPDTLANPVMQGLQMDLARLEGQRQQLSTIAGPNNPDYRQLVGQIGAIRAQIAEQRQRIVSGASVAAAQSGSSVAQLSAALTAQKQRVIDSKIKGDQVNLLEQDVHALQTVYDQMAARRSQLDLLGESEQTDIAVLSPAVPPELPIWPRTFLMVLAGAMGGGTLGLVAAILLELADQRVRSGDDFEAWLGIPHLGSVRLGSPTARLTSRLNRLLPFRGAAADG